VENMSICLWKTEIHSQTPFCLNIQQYNESQLWAYTADNNVAPHLTTWYTEQANEVTIEVEALKPWLERPIANGL